MCLPLKECRYLPLDALVYLDDLHYIALNHSRYSSSIDFTFVFYCRTEGLPYDSPGIQTFIKKGCDEYESVKKTPSYKCWSKEFLCAAKDVVKKTVDTHVMKKGNDHQLWYGYFETPSGKLLQDARDQEINWITKMRWNDPRLLYWAKTDLQKLGKDMLDRIFFLSPPQRFNGAFVMESALQGDCRRKRRDIHRAANLCQMVVRFLYIFVVFLYIERVLSLRYL